jgi:hypothetical protein
MDQQTSPMDQLTVLMKSSRMQVSGRRDVSLTKLDICPEMRKGGTDRTSAAIRKLSRLSPGGRAAQ